MFVFSALCLYFLLLCAWTHIVDCLARLIMGIYIAAIPYYISLFSIAFIVYCYYYSSLADILIQWDCM